jgi:hypothetical protein
MKPDPRRSKVPNKHEKKDGADERIRTADLRITNALLYQLSYVGTSPEIGGVRV